MSLNRLVRSIPLLVSTVSLLAIHASVRGDLDVKAVRMLQSATSEPDLDQSELTTAWKRIAVAAPDDVPELLRAFDQATPVGTNWLSAALDSVLERGIQNGIGVPGDQLYDFVLDSTNGPRGREIALELLAERDKPLSIKAIEGLIDDADPRLRRPSITRLIQRAENQAETEQLATYQRAFDAALDEDHVVTCAVALRERGHPVDHIRKFGMIMHWQILGPFDYLDGKGFDMAYPPESLELTNYDGDEGIFSETSFAGKEGKSISWTSYVNTSRTGVVDLNKALDAHRDAVAYGATVFESPAEQQVELRLRQQNSAKVWLNGEVVFSQPVGHTGNFFDQYKVPVTLKKGPNLILVKSCQWAGEVSHPFLAAWQFCVRVTDATGNAVLAANRPPTPTLDPIPNRPTREADEEEENAPEDQAGDAKQEPRENVDE